MQKEPTSEPDAPRKSRVVLIRDPGAISEEGKPDAEKGQGDEGAVGEADKPADA